MPALWSIIDSAVEEALKAHPDYFTTKGHEAARKLIVRRVASALRDSVSAPKAKTDEAQQPEQQTHVHMDCWSRAWWAVLLAKINVGQSTSWMLSYAMDRGSVNWTEKTEDMPSSDVIATFSNYPSDGEVMRVWRPWFEAHGVRLPNWESRVWVFLPGPDPPVCGE